MKQHFLSLILVASLCTSNYSHAIPKLTKQALKTTAQNLNTNPKAIQLCSIAGYIGSFSASIGTFYVVTEAKTTKKFIKGCIAPWKDLPLPAHIVATILLSAATRNTTALRKCVKTSALTTATVLGVEAYPYIDEKITELYNEE